MPIMIKSGDRIEETGIAMKKSEYRHITSSIWGAMRMFDAKPDYYTVLTEWRRTIRMVKGRKFLMTFSMNWSKI